MNNGNNLHQTPIFDRLVNEKKKFVEFANTNN